MRKGWQAIPGEPDLERGLAAGAWRLDVPRLNGRLGNRHSGGAPEHAAQLRDQNPTSRIWWLEDQRRGSRLPFSWSAHEAAKSRLASVGWYRGNRACGRVLFAIRSTFGATRRALGGRHHAVVFTGTAARSPEDELGG